MFNEKYQEILELVLQINKETEYAAFFNFSGHVNCMRVFIAKGKNGQKEYNDHIYETDFFAEFNPEKTLDNIINELKEFLEVR